ncbi:hypothetical protein G7059_09745 [Erysipelothrix sp. HDW6A]|uniref:hypothetical protein n=1 Tax=Erysipelothrix sp. HDW6A TaxID=2714928 RepID=UPI00140D0E79|nr:hypothetical protein [Erysipelothrix sp. HDW6A]QIK58105.1 hypothetical protein G7059_09745 [Erysipelothrix sp. HDW6A]
MKILKRILLTVISIIVVFFSSIFIVRKIRIETIRELVYEANSPNNLSTLRIYQRGGDNEVWFVTPMEIECSNSFGTQSTRTDLKNGHMIDFDSGKKVEIVWDETETSGKVVTYHNVPFKFLCKINKE